MAVRLLSNQSVNGDIDVNHSQNAITYVAVTNLNTGVSANARVQVVGETSQLDLIATSAGYTGVTGWADSGIITTDSGASGGLKLNAQAGGLQFQIAASTTMYIMSAGLVGINNDCAATALSVKDTQDSVFTSGISIIRSANSDTGYINMVGGAFNLNSSKNTKLRVSDVTKLEVRSSGINVIGETETDTLKVTGSTEFTGGATFGGNIIIYNSTNAPYIDFVESGATSDSKARITMDQVDTDNGTLLFSTEGLGTLSERMRIGSNGYVGMGIANTNNQRITLAEADANGSHIKMNNSRTGGGFWVNGVGDDGSSASIVPPGGIFWYNGTTRMVIDSSGKVGIGTTTPQKKFHIEGTGGASEMQILVSSASDTVGHTAGIGLRGEGGEADGDFRIKGGIFFERIAGSFGNGKMILAVNSSVSNTSVTVADHALTIDTNKNVGIGTTSPSSKLTIVSEANVGSLEFLAVNAATTTNKIIFSEAVLGDESFFIEHDGAGAGAANLLKIFGDGAGGTAGGITIQRDGKVGIGTDSPGSILDVVDTSGTTTLTLGRSGEVPLITAGGTNTDLRLSAVGPGGFLDFHTNGSSRMLIQAGGNVGIGTTSPDGKLEVAGGTTLGFRLSNAGDSAAYDQVRMTYGGYNSGAPTVTFMPLTSPGGGNVDTTFHFSNSNGLAANNNRANVKIDGILNVGSARQSGETTLIMQNYDASLVDSNEIQNSIRMSGRYWSGSASQLVETRINSVHQEANGNGGSALTFMTQTGGSAVTEKMRIDKSGNVGINDTGPSQKLSVVGDASGTSDVVRINHGSGSHTGNGLNIRSANTGKALYVDGSSGAGFAEITTAYNANPNIRTSGDVVAYASSDKRFKDNLEVIQNPIDKIHKLNGYTFDWNDKQDVYKGKDYGVVAQEVEKVMPELVDTRFDGYKAVKYEKLVPLLIESIKELKAEIEELKKNR